MRFRSGDQDDDVETINRPQCIAVLASGEHVPVALWLDFEGDECSAEDAVVAVAGPDEEGRWFAIDLSAFEPAFLN